MRRPAAIALAAIAAAAAAAACGKSDSNAPPPADTNDDAIAPPTDAGMPPLPTLGMQVDRMGRAGVSDTMIGVFGANGAGKQDAYNQASDPTMWATTTLSPGLTVVDELKVAIGALDAVDTGAMVMGQPLGCGNALAYTMPDLATSYNELANLLADDQLYLDTADPSCSLYLALELEYEHGRVPVHTACGGRTPSYDAFDVQLSLLAEGVVGLDAVNNYAPVLHSGVTAHTLLSTFPFLSAPN